MAASLIPRTGGSPIFLDKPIVLIGRHQDCDAVLQSSTKVSRRHCCVARVNEHFVIRDLGSMNGIRVNGARVIEALLGAGDEIAIGDQVFVLNLGQAAAKGGEKKNAEKQRSNGHPPAPSGNEPRDAQPARAPDDLSMEFPVAIPEEPEEGFRSKTQSDDDVLPPAEESPIRKEPMDDIQLKEPSASGFDFVLHR